MAVELDGRAGVGANGVAVGGLAPRGTGSAVDFHARPLDEPTELDLFEGSENLDEGDDGADDDADDQFEEHSDEDLDDQEDADEVSGDLQLDIPRVTPGHAVVPTARRDPANTSPVHVALHPSPRAAPARQTHQVPVKPRGQHLAPVPHPADLSPASLPKPVRELAKLLDDEGYTAVLATLDTVSDTLSIAPCNAFGIEAKSGAAVSRQPVCIARGCILSWVRKVYRSSEPGGAPAFENVSVSLYRAGQDTPYFRAIVPTKPESLAVPDPMLAGVGNATEAGMLPMMLNFMRESQAQMRDFMRQQAEDSRKLLESIAANKGQSDGRAARFMDLADNMVESALTTSIAAIHKVQERVLGSAADELSHAASGAEPSGKARKPLTPNQVLAQAIDEAKERKRLLREGAEAGVVPADAVDEEDEGEEEEEEDPWDEELPTRGAAPKEDDNEVAQVQQDPLTRLANGIRAVAEAAPAVVRGYQQTMGLLRNPGSALNTMAESLEGDAGGGQQ